MLSYVTVAQKRGPNEEKSDFEILTFVKIYGNISSTFPDMAILYISLTINFAFVFN